MSYTSAGTLTLLSRSGSVKVTVRNLPVSVSCVRLTLTFWQDISNRNASVKVNSDIWFAPSDIGLMAHGFFSVKSHSAYCKKNLHKAEGRHDDPCRDNREAWRHRCFGARVGPAPVHS